MKKTIKLSVIAVFLITGFLVTACGGSPPPSNDEDWQLWEGWTPTAPGSMSNMSALEFFRHHNLRAGWNLGNTLDAVNGARTQAIETAWGNPLATQQLITGVRAQGFDILRIPVTWIGHIGPGPNYTVSQTRLQRVKQVVNFARDAGFQAIIINIHHDGNFTSPPNTWGFVCMRSALASDARKMQIQNQLAIVWRQIAEYFINYGEYLIFETMNEVHAGRWGANFNEPGGRREQEILFDWHQAALNAIRATGGNNSTRFVAVGGVGSTEPSYVISSHSHGLLLPNDGANGTRRLIVKAHYYHPWRYTVADITGQGDGALIHTWPSPGAPHHASRDHANNAFRQLRTTFIDNGIAVFIGEWGAQTGARRNMSQTIRDTHVDYIRTVAAAARANEIPPIIWDDGGNFRMLERSNGVPNAGLARDTLNALMRALAAN